MKQLVIALLVKLGEKYPKIDFKPLMKELDPDFEAKIKWVKKTGLNVKTITELYERLDLDSREELLTKLFINLYPEAKISKHPKHRAWLLKLGDHKLFYAVEADNVTMPMGMDEPRVFPAASFVENLPKLEEFIKYLSTYSMRERRRFRF